jgi:hypothetical protein
VDSDELTIDDQLVEASKPLFGVDIHLQRRDIDLSSSVATHTTGVRVASSPLLSNAGLFPQQRQRVVRRDEWRVSALVCQLHLHE